MGTFAGLPLHPLAIHAAVVFIPLSVLAAIVFAVVPRFRWVLRWPVAVLALVSVGSAIIAKTSGDALSKTFAGDPLVAVHKGRADVLVILVYVFAALCLIAVFTLGGRSPLPAGQASRAAVGGVAVQMLVAVVVVAMGIVVAVQVVRAGDAGARAVWSNTRVLPQR